MWPRCGRSPRYRPPSWRAWRSASWPERRRVRARVPVRSLLLRHFLLTGDGTPRTLLGPCIGMGPLAPDRKTPTVPNATIAPDVHQALDVHGHFGTERALHLHRALDHLAEPGHLGVRQIADPGVRVDARLAQDAAAGGTTDAEDVGE